MKSDIVEIDFGIDSEKGGEIAIIYKKEWFEIFAVTPQVKADIQKWISQNVNP